MPKPRNKSPKPFESDRNKDSKHPSFKGKKTDSRNQFGERRERKPNTDRNYNSSDPDEIAPPRFLAPRDKNSSYGRNPKPQTGDFNKGRDKRGPGKFNSPYGNKTRDFQSRDQEERPVKRGAFRSGGPEKGKFEKSERNSPFKKRTAGFSNSFDKSKKYKPDQKFKPGLNDADKDVKAYKPKFDSQVKTKKSYTDRKKELLGITDSPDDIRLNKYIANSGVCSRREADQLIAQGLVSVNGNVVTEMGYRVKKGEIVKYDGRKILPEPFVYILMNKPKDFITTTDDEKGRKTVLDIIGDKVPQRVYPIGRLDRNTTGVLLLTNDGDVAQALTHPSFQIKKVYHVVLDKKVNGSDLDKLVEGIELEDGIVHADGVAFVDNEDKRHVGVEIHSGKNRVVRRLFEHLGYEVEKLDRVSMGIFTKKDLPRGKWRFLSQSEVGFLTKLKSKMT